MLSISSQESHCLNVESNFVKSLSNHDTLKFDHLDEFSRALMPIHITEEERIRKEHAEYIRLMERLITINLCPRPMENANTIIKSLPLSLILIQHNDSQREDIDIVTNTDELLPPGFENDDSEGEIDVLEELRVDNSISNSENNPRGEFDISTNVEDNDYFPFTWVIYICLPYLIYSEVFLLLLSAESEDTIFDP
nr:hypothetical protein [Tanacetum cinerariifolium]